ncbi:MAG: GTP cyclohydrolase II [Rickettsiales bacterium]|jgi:GTP cyclohydrolase II
MINKNEDSKNNSSTLKSAINNLRRQDGIVIEQKNNERIAIYPAELLNETEQKKYPLTNSPTLIKLAKRAGLLPALVVLPINDLTKNWEVFSEEILEQALQETGDKIFETARAKLPIDGAEDAVIASFRAQGDEAVHLALIIGKSKNNELPVVRVHSSCVTGDLLGSLRCDCGDQLKLALATIKAAGYGVLLYLNQEGRGIGITNKFRAYQLQEQGLDTYAANHALGFESDERDFNAASSILKHLGISEIKLLSNNPHKVAEIEKHGITIAQRVPLIVQAGEHNRAYITAKAQKAGHILGDNVGESD